MEWDIIYDEEIRMSERNDQNPYIFIPHSEEVGSGEDVEAVEEGSGDNEDYDGDLQYDNNNEDTLHYSGDGLILEEGSADVELGQRRMDYSDYESPNDVQDLSALIEEEGTVNYIDQQQELEPMPPDLLEEEAQSLEMLGTEESKQGRLMADEHYQTQFDEIARPTESGENEEDLNQIVESLDTIDDMDMDTIEDLNTIESMLTSILGNINLVSQQQYDVQYQTQFDLSERVDPGLGEETEETKDHLTANNPTISSNTEYEQVEEYVPVDVDQHLHGVVSDSHIEPEAGLEPEPEAQSEQEAKPKPDSEPEPESEPKYEPEPEADSEPEAEAEFEAESDFEPEAKFASPMDADPKPQQKDKVMPANLQNREYDPNYEQQNDHQLRAQDGMQQTLQEDHQLRSQEEVHLEAHLKQASKLEIEDEQEGRPQHALTLGPRPHFQEALEHKHEFRTESSEVIVNDLNYINNGELGENRGEKEPHNAPVVGKEGAAIGEISAKNGVERETPGEISAEDNVQVFAMSENDVDRKGKEVDMMTDGNEPLQIRQDKLDGNYKENSESSEEIADDTEQQSISELAGTKKGSVVYYGANKKPRQAGNEAMVRDASKDPAKDEGNIVAKEEAMIAKNTLGIGRTDEDRTSDKAPLKMAMIDKKVNEYQSTDVNFVHKSAKENQITKEENESKRKDSMFFLPAGHGLFFGFKLGEMEKTDKMRLEIFANNQIHTDIDSSTIELAL